MSGLRFGLSLSMQGRGRGKRFDPADPRLSWAPPAQTNPTIIQLPTGFFQTDITSWTNLSGNGRGNGPRVLDDDEDVIYLPFNGIRNNNSDVNLMGGRHVRCIGGHYRSRLQTQGVTGSWYLEGVEFDLSSAPNKDVIAAGGKSGFQPDIYIQNCFVTGPQGTVAGTHADIFQPYTNIGTLYIDKLTGDSNYQGLFLRPAFLIDAAIIRRTNLKFNALGTPAGTTYLYWFRNMAGDSAAPGDPLYPITLTECYAEANNAVPGRAAAYPPPGEATQGEPSAEAYAGIVDDDGNMSWPAGSNIKGTVKLGDPPGGAFVAAANVGVGYTGATEFQNV